MRIARPITRLIESFQKLPGVGPKTAARLTFYLLRVPQTDLDEFSSSLASLKRETKLCRLCKNVAETDPCPICEDRERDISTILVVEEPLDIIAFEKTGKYNGVYHVLHGAINPLENIGPDEIFIDQLIDRIRNNKSKIKEVIIGTNPTMEGEATAMYLRKRIQELANGTSHLKVTRLGMGIPTGADLEYADETTLREALAGRRTL